MGKNFFILTFVFLVFFYFSVFAFSFEGTIKIGAIFAKTGNASVVTSSGFEAAKFAIDEINKKGGVIGKQIILVEYDNQSTPIGSKFAGEKAVKDGVTGVIGCAFSSYSLAIAKVLQNAKIPMITPSATNVAVSFTGNYIFRVCYVDTFQGRIAADFAQKDLKAETAAVFTDSSSKYSLGLAKIFIERFSQKGHTLCQKFYQKGMTNFMISLMEIQHLNPDIIFIPGHFRESAYIIKQAREMGMKEIFIGADGWVKKMYKYGGNSIDGSFYVAQWHKDIDSEKNREFVKNWLAQGGKLDGSLRALTYDAIYVLVHAIKEAGTTNREEIRNYLSITKDFPGVTGTISFNKNGDPVNKAGVIMKFENGQTVFQKTIAP